MQCWEYLVSRAGTCDIIGEIDERFSAENACSTRREIQQSLPIHILPGL